MRVHALDVTLLVSALLAGGVGCGAPSEKAAESAAEAAEVGGSKPGDADNDEEKDHVDLSPEVRERLGVRIGQVAPAPLAVAFRVTGSVQPVESRMARVRPLARGRILDVLAKVGDRVSAGRALARFDNIEAGELATQHESAQAELARLRVELSVATRQAERSARLAEIGAVPTREYEASLAEQQQVEASIRAQESAIAGMGARLRRFGAAGSTARDQSAPSSITSPLAGVVIQVHVGTGDVVDPSTELFAIADLSRVYVQAHVFEKDLAKVRNGQTATVTVDAYPDQRFAGRVAAVGGTLDPRTRTVPVRVEVANPETLLKLDMFATVDLATSDTAPGLAVPRHAVQSIEGRQVVFVQTGNDGFEVRRVRTGRLAGTLIEITQGLEAGDTIVTQGAFKVKSALLAGELPDDDDDKEPR